MARLARQNFDLVANYQVRIPASEWFSLNADSLAFKTAAALSLSKSTVPELGPSSVLGGNHVAAPVMVFVALKQTPEMRMPLSVNATASMETIVHDSAQVLGEGSNFAFHLVSEVSQIRIRHTSDLRSHEVYFLCTD